MATRSVDSSTTLSAKFLQARITALSTTLIKRLENIFAATLEEPPLPNSDEANNPPPPALVDTAVKQLQLDVESTALIRAAEELMMLTRTMKEVWLFGGLDTIPTAVEDGGGDGDVRGQIDEDEKFVVQGFMEYLSNLEKVGDTKEIVNGKND